MKINLLHQILSYVNPIFFYYAVIYGSTKIFESMFGFEYFWQSVWHRIMDIFGDSEYFYIVWALNGYTFLLYWIFGGIFLLLETLICPKVLTDYKIQKNQSKIQKDSNVYQVTKKLLKLIFCFQFKIFSGYSCRCQKSNGCLNFDNCSSLHQRQLFLH